MSCHCPGGANSEMACFCDDTKPVVINNLTPILQSPTVVPVNPLTKLQAYAKANPMLSLAAAGVVIYLVTKK